MSKLIKRLGKHFYGANPQERRKGIRNLFAFLFCSLIFIAFWFIPPNVYGLPSDLPITQQRVIALFIFAALLWIAEPVPAWVTSITVLVLLLLTVSDSGFTIFRADSEGSLGTLINHQTLIHTFADPIIMLFMGGFVLAMAASHVGLDVAIARLLLKPFGTKSEYVLLAFIFITGFSPCSLATQQRRLS